MTPQAAVLTFSGRTYANEAAAMADLLRLFEAVADAAHQEGRLHAFRACRHPAYSIRKWAQGETTNLRLHVVDATGRVVFSSASYDEVKAERDRLNAGGPEAVPLVRGDRREIRQPDGTIRFEISPEPIRPFP